MKEDRIEYLDIARGLTILMIVAFHVLGETIPIYHHFVDTMGLQVFLFVTGFFFCGFYLKSNIKKMVIPYGIILVLVRILWDIRLGLRFDFLQIKDLLKQVILGYTIDDCWQEQSVYVGIVWFLTFLVMSRLLYAMVCKIEENNEFIKGILCFTISSIGIMIGIKTGGAKLPWNIDVAMATIVFLYLGDLAHKNKKKFEEFTSKYVLFIPMLVVWYALVRVFDFSELATRKYPNGITQILISMLAVAIVLQCSSFISKYLKKSSLLLQLCGKHSMYILCAHIIDKSCITYPAGMNIYLQLVIEVLVAVLPAIVIILWEIIRNKRVMGSKKEN